ncbi:MAG: transglutaminase family protein [Alphaproteobacteria bacterium]|nr:transglutaminase family protein [Alphaproteobacteria bacterium]
MRIAVKHVTTFVFSEQADHSIHHLRLVPRPALGQRIMHWRIAAPARLADWSDGYGNQVRTFVLHQPHREVRVGIEGVFETNGENGGTYLSYPSDDSLPPAFWLRNHGLARHDEAIGSYVADLAGRDAGERISVLHELMGRIHADVAYLPGVSEVATTALETLERRSGVCQDHAHLFIACCRRLGIPARYVSGYMRVLDEGMPADATHAWAEAHVPFLGWIGFDPTNRLCPNGNYLKLAVGLDYRDAGPIVGRRVGGGEARLEVDVSVQVVAGPDAPAGGT